MKHSLLVVLLLLVLMFTACGSPSSSLVLSTSRASPSEARSAVSLRVLAQRHGLFIGTTVNMDALRSDPTYASVLAREFDMVTPENVMKWNAVHPAPQTYIFAQADALVAFAQAHQMQVRGHNLVWYRALPDWLANGTFTRAQLLAILKEHIFTVVSHFRQTVNIWDVVNEAVADNGALRQSIWLRDIGPDYIDWAFRWAHAANPRAHLFYNDYDGEGLGVKSDAIYRLVKGMLQRDVPIYGVGLQMHTSTLSPPAMQDVVANMQRLSRLGLKVQITEMDVQLQNDPRPLAQKLVAQAQVYRSMLSACLTVQACEAFVMWGFTDRYSWIPSATGHPDEPLIFDTQYRPKPAYYALEQTLA
jgi:endo-1,4-beta-xylanase